MNSCIRQFSHGIPRTKSIQPISSHIWWHVPYTFRNKWMLSGWLLCFMAGKPWQIDWIKKENIINNLSNNIIHNGILPPKPCLSRYSNQEPRWENKKGIFYKRFDSKHYFLFTSYHSKHTKHNIPFDLAKGICTIVSQPPKREQGLEEMKDTLVQISFSPGITTNGINKTKQMDFNELRKKTKERNMSYYSWQPSTLGTSKYLITSTKASRFYFQKKEWKQS